MVNAKVFFVERSPRFNTRSADRFGTVTFLMENDAFSPFQTDRVMKTVNDKLTAEGYDPERDFIAITGGHVLVAMFLASALYRSGKVRALLFDARSSRYQERIIEAQAEDPQVTPGTSEPEV